MTASAASKAVATKAVAAKTVTAGPLSAAGPLGAAVTIDSAALQGRLSYQLREGANPLILLRRVAFLDSSGNLDSDAEKALLGWAEGHRLGQEAVLLGQAQARRERAIAALTADQAQRAVRLLVRPMWRLAVGIGNRANPYEIGLALHGTYGCPVIPASTIKGAASAFAWSTEPTGDDLAKYHRVFGLPRAGRAAAKADKGTVCFLDALPHGGPVNVRRDVVTPHVQPYYRERDRLPPAEYHQPIPADFLTIGGGAFAIDLVGPEKDVTAAAAWCAQAVDELGLGGKTSAGYGYLTAEREDLTAGREDGEP